MGRSTRSQAAQNRARIVDAASEMFRRHGVGATSISDIMKAVGMTQGGFYNHFASKDQLASEAVAKAFEQSTAAWASAVSLHGSTREGSPTRSLVSYYLASGGSEDTCPMLAFGCARRRRADASKGIRSGNSRSFRYIHEAYGHPAFLCRSI
ncbi:TetR/AcrR family transcriptional regulator [Cupriavidus alkaliphilus]|uniref:TetR family transcriptional regulator n=1 Tax=Cupriavidus oxalaticus TaxID=96344 RepID=A0A4P7LL59_9BURK|nr:TetR family transcriptional regulator [Cupriavidus oxalaticus]